MYLHYFISKSTFMIIIDFYVSFYGDYKMMHQAGR